MRVVVLADTHIPDFARTLPPALVRDLVDADLILHAGDVTTAAVLDELARYAPVRVALGNNDRPDVRRWGAREVVRLALDGLPTVVVHDAGPRLGRAARLARRYPEARLVIFGHSHIPLIERSGRLTLLNPGSPTWKRRQPYPTYAVVTVRAGRLRAAIRAMNVKNGGNSGVRRTLARPIRGTRPLHKPVSER